MNRSSSFHRSEQGGFTLIELLTTLSVVAILAGMLLPALARARGRARSVQCLANLRQWGLALRLYADDNDDFLPRRGQGVQTLAIITRADDWFNALPPYLALPAYAELVDAGSKPKPGDHSLFICPDAVDPGATNFLCYGMNMNLSTWNLPLPTRFGDVLQPALVAALADAPGPYASTYPSKQPYSPAPRHVGRANVLFLAGGARSFSGAYLGCGAGDPGRDDVRWLTGTPSDAQAHNY